MATCGRPSSRTSADELRRLLAGVPTPYVVIGHSIGALIALIVAADPPEGLAGLVLVDPTDLQLDLDVEQQTLFLRDGEREDCTTFDTLASLPAVTASQRRLEMPSVVVTSRPDAWLELEDPTPWKPFTLEDLRTRWQQVHHHLANTLGSTHLIATQGAHYIQKDQPSLITRSILSVVAPLGG
ncbi:alpha/beta fold hydrolase [Kribbella sp. NPDC051586]|uniref:alpha/beta fold hydrolase n=1 Tax=Kribbella sp. NPDC051586 TaxID=3364118 RepID=UPI0037B0465D